MPLLIFFEVFGPTIKQVGVFEIMVSSDVVEPTFLCHLLAKLNSLFSRRGGSLFYQPFNCLIPYETILEVLEMPRATFGNNPGAHIQGQGL